MRFIDVCAALRKLTPERVSLTLLRPAFRTVRCFMLAGRTADPGRGFPTRRERNDVPRRWRNSASGEARPLSIQIAQSRRKPANECRAAGLDSSRTRRFEETRMGTQLLYRPPRRRGSAWLGVARRGSAASVQAIG